MFELILNNQKNNVKIILESFQDFSIENSKSLNGIISDTRIKYKDEKDMNIIFREIEVSDNFETEEFYSNIEGVIFLGLDKNNNKRNIKILREVIYEI